MRHLALPSSDRRVNSTRFSTPAILAIAICAVMTCAGLSLALAQGRPHAQTLSGGGLSPLITCKPVSGYVCVTVSLPYSSGSYLGTVDFGGTIVSTPEAVLTQLDTVVDISVNSLSSGYAFSFWGTSPSSISVASFESGSTTADITGTSELYLNVYEGSAGSDVQFSVFHDPSSDGQILLENHAFIQGQSAWLTKGVGYSVTAQGFASGFTFFQWATGSGSVSSPTSATTTFTPSSASAALDLQVGYPSNWGGLVYDGATASEAQGEFTLPTFTASDSTVAVGFWVGIGGVDGTNLWQAGVLLIYGSTGDTINAFYEEIGPSCGGCPAVLSSTDIPQGQTFSIVITATSGGTDSFSVIDVTNGVTYDSGSITGFVAGSQTAEWISECSGCNGDSSTDVMPMWPSTVEFQNAEVNTHPASFAGQDEVALGYYFLGDIGGLPECDTILPSTLQSPYATFYLDSGVTGTDCPP